MAVKTRSDLRAENELQIEQWIPDGVKSLAYFYSGLKEVLIL